MQAANTCFQVIFDLKFADDQSGREQVRKAIKVDPVVWVKFINTTETLAEGTDNQKELVSKLFWDNAKTYFKNN